MSSEYHDLWSRPGYLVRRVHQIHVGLFAEECSSFDMTPVQFALLTVLADGRSVDQVTLSTRVGIDRTSGADVIKRLERHGLLSRIPSQTDRRAKLIEITAEGRALVAEMQASMEAAQERLVSPLNRADRALFADLMRQIIDANNDASRAPMADPAPTGGRSA